MSAKKSKVEENVQGYLASIGQEHLLSLWDTLTDDEKQSMCRQIESFQPLSKICYDFWRAVNHPSQLPADLNSSMHPIEEEFYSSSSSTNPENLKQYWDRGLKAIADNTVGVILLAGGQGSRLGVSYPKGIYDVGLPSRKTLFQLQAERILRLQHLAKASYPDSVPLIHWFIMTSEATQSMTKCFFEYNSFFGLRQDQVTFFEQGLVPCFDMSGKMLLETPSRLATAPDGNGGLYKVLVKSGCLEKAEKINISCFHVYCVDNILVRVADPVFIGYCLENNADCGNKVIEKKQPDESLGVVCKVDGLGMCVVEYSEIPKNLAEERDGSDKLLFRAGNIANHFFTLDFLKDVCKNHADELMYHVAKKKIPFVNENGDLVKSNSPNGIKLEKFIFDVFALAKRFFVWQVEREGEFSPLKNAIGPDSPATCCEDLYRLHNRWLLASQNSRRGRHFNNTDSKNKDSKENVNINKLDQRSIENVDSCHEDESNGSRTPPCTPVEYEISPLVTYRGEDNSNNLSPADLSHTNLASNAHLIEKKTGQICTLTSLTIILPSGRLLVVYYSSEIMGRDSVGSVVHSPTPIMSAWMPTMATSKITFKNERTWENGDPIYKWPTTVKAHTIRYWDLV